jgi:hypothetical protein
MAIILRNQRHDFVQHELEIGGSGDGDFFFCVRRLSHNQQANENQHPRCKPADYAHLDLGIREVVDIFCLKVSLRPQGDGQTLVGDCGGGTFVISIGRDFSLFSILTHPLSTASCAFSKSTCATGL